MNYSENTPKSNAATLKAAHRQTMKKKRIRKVIISWIVILTIGILIGNSIAKIGLAAEKQETLQQFSEVEPYGTIDGKISSNRALAYVHTLRDKIDLLAIGGNTVRIDKPTLDSRYIQGNNPDIFIYTKNKIFDKNIPLFNISNRKVIISDDLFKLLDYKFVMFEGTYTLLDKLKERIDFIVLLISPKIRKGNNALNEIDMDFEVIHENFIGEDKIVFLKRR